ncbi:hypothetical protein [Mycolicibacterium sp. 120270]|uniref:hypothetical protein n=1 Tax=Mycolicibacterium sp. 120270 TaxID=3090600 RepID=UPI00299CF0D0|nr:hypothetical protein [Mycolicibacterium sp. 120270]MDX1885106.1 hypothetical protein [Mycolicibacterium sp. 120270]
MMSGRFARLLIGALLVELIALAFVVMPRQDPVVQVADPGQEPISQISGLPPGATECEAVYPTIVTPFNAGARGTPMTSCPFVEQVRRAYSLRPAPLSAPQQMRVASPATGQWYDLVCAPTQKFVTCTGAVVAVIYLYNT